MICMLVEKRKKIIPKFVHSKLILGKKIHSVLMYIRGLGLWSLAPLSTIFRLHRGSQFYDTRNYMIGFN
jgi:hypothetical protein